MDVCAILWAIKTVGRELNLCRSFLRYESVNASLVRPCLERREMASTMHWAGQRPWMDHSTDKDGLPLKRH